MRNVMGSLAVAAALFAASAISWTAFGHEGHQHGAATQPACCGDECKKMDGCCTTDDKGKITCSMGGKCCKKTDDKDKDKGMDMGK